MAFHPFRKKAAVVKETVTTPTFFSLEFIQQFLAAGVSATDKMFLELYLTVPELQAIINYRGRAFAGMRIKAEDKAGKEVENFSMDVLKNPNPLQTMREFAMQYHVLRDIFGNDFIHPVFGKDPSQTQTMWNLPPCNAEIVPVNDKLIVFNMTDIKEIIKEYKFNYGGDTITYQPEEIIHFNDNQVSFTDNKFLIGDSRIRPLVQACDNIKAAYEARGILIKNSALGILSNDTKDGMGSVPLDPSDKENLQKDYEKYGLTKKKWQLIITNASLKWQSMAVEVGKLKLFEEVDADYRAIAGAYSFPPELLQPKEGTSLNTASKDEALRQLYQDSIIPEADEWLQGLADFFKLDVILKSDFSHIPVLQADLAMRSTAMQRSSMGLAKALEGGFIQLPDAEEQFKKYLL